MTCPADGVPGISAIVLAGGKSRRLGLDKALLRLDGEWLLQRILDALATLSDDLLVVANDAGKLAHIGVRIVADAWRGDGPLVGIYTGLQAMRHDRGLFVACDMPFLNLGLLCYMVGLSGNFDVVIPRLGDEVEPLHAIYSRSCTPLVADALARGEHRVVSFFPQARVRYVEQPEVDAFDTQHRSFFNINTLADLKAVEQSIRHPATTVPRS